MSINSKLSNNVFVIAAGVTAVAIAGCGDSTNTQCSSNKDCTAADQICQNKQCVDNKPTNCTKSDCKVGQFCNNTSLKCVKTFECSLCDADTEVCNKKKKICEPNDKKVCNPACKDNEFCNKKKKTCEAKVTCDDKACTKYNAETNKCDTCDADTQVCKKDKCEAKKPDPKSGECTSTWKAVTDFVAKGDYSVLSEALLGATLEQDYEKCQTCIETKIDSTYRPYVKQTVKWVKNHEDEAIHAKTTEQQEKFGTDLTKFFNKLGKEAKTDEEQKKVRDAVYAASKACGGPDQKELKKLVDGAADFLAPYGINPKDIEW